jgi:hypothetical protein
MTIRVMAAIGFGTSYLLLAADEPKQKVQVSKTVADSGVWWSFRVP